MGQEFQGALWSAPCNSLCSLVLPCALHCQRHAKSWWPVRTGTAVDWGECACLWQVLHDGDFQLPNLLLAVSPPTPNTPHPPPRHHRHHLIDAPASAVPACAERGGPLPVGFRRCSTARSGGWRWAPTASGGLSSRRRRRRCSEAEGGGGRRAPMASGGLSSRRRQRRCSEAEGGGGGGRSRARRPRVSLRTHNPR